jgi:hypothetical protein
MVIHDVKHPTTSLISILRNMSDELTKLRSINTVKITSKLDNMNTFIDSLLKQCDESEQSVNQNFTSTDSECKMENVSEGNNK